MTDKQIIDVCPYQGECSVSGCKRNDDGCFVKQLFEERYRAENRIVELNKTIQAKEQDCEDWKSKYYTSTTETKADLIKQIEELKKDNDEIHEKMATVIYRATGGHLSYSTYTLDAIEQAREDRLAIDVEHKTEEYREVIDQLRAEKEVIRNYLGCGKNETILQRLDGMVDDAITCSNKSKQYKQALQEIRQVVEFAMEEVLTIGQRNATAKILEIIKKCEVIDD